MRVKVCQNQAGVNIFIFLRFFDAVILQSLALEHDQQEVDDEQEDHPSARQISGTILMVEGWTGYPVGMDMSHFYDG